MNEGNQEPDREQGFDERIIECDATVSTMVYSIYGNVIFSATRIYSYAWRQFIRDLEFTRETNDSRMQIPLHPL